MYNILYLYMYVIIYAYITYITKIGRIIGKESEYEEKRPEMQVPNLWNVPRHSIFRRNRPKMY